MAKYRVLMSDKVFIEEEIEADNLEQARKKARELLDENGFYEVDHYAADLLPVEKYYFRIESVEPVED